MPCWYCGIRLKKGGPAMKTKDHVVPKSQGGKWTVDACLRCNAAKKDMSLEEFRQLCGGTEFWGEMKTRLEDTKTAWLVKEDMPNLTTPPTFMPNLSKIVKFTHANKTKKEINKELNTPTACLPRPLLGTRFGGFTVVRRITGKWEVQCMCGAIEYRTSKAVLNTANTFDACVECRKPIGKLKSDIFKEFGVDVTWEDCFRHIYEPHLETIKEKY